MFIDRSLKSSRVHLSGVDLVSPNWLCLATLSFVPTSYWFFRRCIRAAYYLYNMEPTSIQEAGSRKWLWVEGLFRRLLTSWIEGSKWEGWMHDNTHGMTFPLRSRRPDISANDKTWDLRTRVMNFSFCYMWTATHRPRLSFLREVPAWQRALALTIRTMVFCWVVYSLRSLCNEQGCFIFTILHIFNSYATAVWRALHLRSWIFGMLVAETSIRP